MKAFVLSPRENWICDRIFSEFVANSNIVTHDPHAADVLWLLAGWCWNQLPQSLLAAKKVIATIHHIVPEKFTQQKRAEFVYRDQFVDAYHVPNEHTSAFVAQLTDKPIIQVGYWYDESKWFPIDRPIARASLGLPNEKFIVGSFQRDTEGNTMKPKLEKGPDRLVGCIEQLHTQHDLLVLLGGWRRGFIMGELTKRNIPFVLGEKVTQATLNAAYNACDLYLVTSRHEGGPQSLLECAATHTPILSTDVGMARDILTADSIFVPEAYKGYLPGSDTIRMNFERVQQYEIKTQTQKYIAMLESV
jgi:glycosyltransferase involved in cell wall biosynthesis